MEKAMELYKEYDGDYLMGYQCGRWLACLDHVQYISSQGGVNVSVAKKYYKAMKKKPAQIFTLINDNKEIYLSKLKSRKKYDDLFGEISKKIKGEIPNKFSFEQQAAFDLGYAQQRMDLLNGGDKTSDNKEEKENE